MDKITDCFDLQFWRYTLLTGPGSAETAIRFSCTVTSKVENTFRVGIFGLSGSRTSLRSEDLLSDAL